MVSFCIGLVGYILVGMLSVFVMTIAYGKPEGSEKEIAFLVFLTWPIVCFGALCWVAIEASIALAEKIREYGNRR